ncbi:GNAT family N-acetyltransferase [Plantibacter flavus]
MTAPAVRAELSALLLDYHRQTEAEKATGGTMTEPASAQADALPERYRAEVVDPARAFAGQTVLLAADGATLLGCVVLTGGPEPELKRLWVTPAARRRGVAGALIDHAATLATERGDRTLRLSVWSWREAAIALYERSGFAPAASWDDRPELSCFIRRLT